ncbi:uncharacterized protein LOC108207205 [Daucus carota subsp. sativus]|uniref:uncharacterized protein LOC108207205 n=1 Tax=Daucus carota subsp. sativus TaxID=79200 RepID=UPI003083E483
MLYLNLKVLPVRALQKQTATSRSIRPSTTLQHGVLSGLDTLGRTGMRNTFAHAILIVNVFLGQVCGTGVGGSSTGIGDGRFRLGCGNPVIGGIICGLGGDNHGIGGSNDGLGGGNPVIGGTKFGFGGVNEDIGGSKGGLGGDNPDIGGSKNELGGDNNVIGGGIILGGGCGKPVTGGIRFGIDEGGKRAIGGISFGIDEGGAPVIGGIIIVIGGIMFGRSGIGGVNAETDGTKFGIFGGGTKLKTGGGDIGGTKLGLGIDGGGNSGDTMLVIGGGNKEIGGTKLEIVGVSHGIGGRIILYFGGDDIPGIGGNNPPS